MAPAGCAAASGWCGCGPRSGNIIWTTFIFPASLAGYVLPVKRAVRVAGALDAGDVATVTVELIDFT